VDERARLITGPSARDLVLNDRVFGHLPLIELDEVTIGRRSTTGALVGAPGQRRLLAAVPPPAREGDVPIFQQGGWFDPTRARTCGRSPRSATASRTAC
jgi:hypothetical protein